MANLVKLVVAAELGESIRELRKVRGELGGIEKTAKDTSTKTSEHLSRIGTGATIALGGLAAGLGMATKAALDAQVSQNKLELSVKNAGISWKSYRGEIEDSLTSARKMSGFTDADLETSLAKLVTTTGKVSSATRLQAKAMDLARARGISLQQATTLLSKVWAGSTSSLTRLGIQLPKVTTHYDHYMAVTKNTTAAGKEAAKAADLVSSRQAALAALQTKFGGSAKKYGDTAAGAIARQTAAFDALEVSVGTVMLPLVTKLSNYLTGLINRFNGLSGRTQSFIKIAAGVTVGVLGAVAAITKITQAIQAARAAMVVLNATLLANPIVLVTAGIVALGIALVVAYKKSETFRNIVNGAFNKVKSVASDVIGFVRDHWKALLVVMTGSAGLAVVEIVNHWGKIKSGISSIVGAIRGIWNTAKNDATGAWRSIVNTVDGFINHIIDAYDWVAGKIGLSKIPDLPTFGGGGSGGAGGSSPGGPGGGRRGTHGALGLVQPSGTGGTMIVGEAGHPEAVLSMNPAHAERTFQLMGQVAQHLIGQTRQMSLGGIVGSVGGAVKGAVGSALGFLNPLSHLPHMPTFSGPLADFGSAVVHKIYNAAEDKLLSLVGGLFGGGGGGAPHIPGVAGLIGSTYAPGEPRPTAQVLGWIRAAMAATQTPPKPAYIGGLLARAWQESGWNPHAINNWDSNARAGHPSEGWFQTIGPTFASYALPGHGDIWNPVDNAIAAIRYMRARYQGNLVGYTGVGYANGGWVGGPVGAPQPAVVHGGELVLTPKQQRQLGNHYHLHITVNGADLSDAATQRRVASRLGTAIIHDLAQQAGR
jgi:hypothetical protein